MFKIKDLMIKVLPGAEGATEPREGCNVPSTCGDCSACTEGSNPCPGGFTCDWGTFCDYTVCGGTCVCTDCSYPSCGHTCTPLDTKPQGRRRVTGNLWELKAALKRQLASIEAQEQLSEQVLKPRTLEEAEALEQKLKEALEELQDIKKQLSKKSSD